MPDISLNMINWQRVANLHKISYNAAISITALIGFEALLEA
jgi:hypothetical protein